jgi:glycosyltransferase involved in cell wall biosynthesis
MSSIAVIPVFNEESTIKKIIEQTSLYVNQIIVVDDGSNDNTYKEAKNTSAYLLRNKVNQGYGAALMSGALIAVQMGADYIVAIDGDGEHNPADITSLLKNAKANDADIVIGSRFIVGGYAYNMSIIKFFSNKISTLMLNLLYKIKISDSQSGFRVYNKRVFKIPLPANTNFLTPTEMLIKSAINGLIITEVPIRSKSRGQKLGHHNIKETFAYILLLLRLLQNN